MFDKRQQPAAQWCWWRRENVCHEKWKMWKCDQYFVDINLTLMVLLLLLLVFRKKKEVEKDIIPTLDGFSSFFSVVVVTPKRWAEHARHNRNLYNLKIVTHIKFAKNFHHNWKRQIALLVFPHFPRCYDTARRRAYRRDDGKLCDSLETAKVSKCNQLNIIALFTFLSISIHYVITCHLLSHTLAAEIIICFHHSWVTLRFLLFVFSASSLVAKDTLVISPLPSHYISRTRLTRRQLI